MTPLPLTSNVINLVHALADRDGIPDGLKIMTKTGHILYDSTSLAGVDYTDNVHNNANANYYVALGDDDDDDDDLDYVPDGDEPDDDDDIMVIPETQSETDPDPGEQDPIDNTAADAEVNVETVEEDEQVNDADDEANNEGNDEGNADPNEAEPYQTRAGHTTKPIDRLGFNQCHLMMQGHKATAYTVEEAKVMAHTINHLNMVARDSEHKHHSFVETYSLKHGLKKFGNAGCEAALKEMMQLHERAAFVPIDVSELTPAECRRAMDSLIFLVEKRDKTVKARTCANGRAQRAYMRKEDTTSPTVLTESILLTSVIDAREGRDVMTTDIPNAFVQTDVEEQELGKHHILKFTGVLIDMLVELDPELYGPYVTYENNVKVLYTLVMKALYGMLHSSMLYYKKFCKDIESIGFKVNPYDPCVANHIVCGTQQTVTWHVDDLKSSHKSSKVNDEFHKWLEGTYASDAIGKVKVVRGKCHVYLGMVLDFSIPGKVQVDMVDYTKNMVEDFPKELSTENVTYPWNDNLFKIDESSPALAKPKAEDFHTFVAKALFLCKHSRPDIEPAISFLTTRTSKPTEQDWFKLKKMMRFLKRTANDVLTLEAGDETKPEWYLDAAFAVHPDFKSHTGATMTLCKGSIQSVSKKQKVNTRSSTESELVSNDDILSKVQWTKLFLESQALDVTDNVIHRDNQSSMKLEANGKASSGKRTRHFNIKYFYITDLIEQNEL